MLLIIETIKVAQPEGANLAEQVEVGKRRLETNYGPKYDPIMECAATGNTPWGNLTEVITPIALRVGDEVQVDQEFGAMVRVRRGGVEIWPSRNDQIQQPALEAEAAQGKRGGK